MAIYKVIKYVPTYYNEWNNFITNSKNGTFLFHRDFMDYHTDRFEDYSLLIFRNEKLIAVLPANKEGGNLHSHQGLTYGGLILNEAVKLHNVMEIFENLLKYLKEFGFKYLYIKQIPSIYKSLFTAEIQYLMFILKAELIRRDTLSVIDVQKKIKISKNRQEGHKRGVKHHLVMKEEEELEFFWNSILIKNLERKYNVSPVHTLEEITSLKRLFPDNIRQFNVYHNNKIVAGTTIFETDHVAHAQYISGNQDKNILGSLDFLHINLIEVVFKTKRFFDFGTSNLNNGFQINKGLQSWKEGFGARTEVQDFYKIDVDNYPLLNNIFI